MTVVLHIYNFSTLPNLFLLYIPNGIYVVCFHVQHSIVPEESFHALEAEEGRKLPKRSGCMFTHVVTECRYYWRNSMSEILGSAERVFN